MPADDVSSRRSAASRFAEQEKALDKAAVVAWGTRPPCCKLGYSMHSRQCCNLYIRNVPASRRCHSHDVVYITCIIVAARSSPLTYNAAIIMSRSLTGAEMLRPAIDPDRLVGSLTNRGPTAIARLRCIAIYSVVTTIYDIVRMA